MERLSPQGAASEVLRTRYPDAESLFLAGSVVREEQTRTSDLDLVVVFERIARARRESFGFGGWPVEAFLHDPSTLRYFMDEVDRPTGVASLAGMVAEGIEIPGPTAFTRELKRQAREHLAGGPRRWGPAEIEASRYAITDLLEDMRDPRTVHELKASAAALYSRVADHYLRSRQLWSARGKAIPRRLRQVAPGFAAEFEAAFEALFVRGDRDRLFALCDALLAPDGGALFDGYQHDAPESWRKETLSKETP